VGERVEEAAESGGVGKVVVVGAGIAGIAAAESLRAASPSVEVTLVSKESVLPYYRLNLTRYLAGETEEQDLPVKPQDWFEQQRVQLMRGVEVSEIDLTKRSVALHGGDSLPFDKLILCVGAHPFMPPLPGASREGVTNLRTLGDAQGILGSGLAGKRCVCIGGGLLGLEAAGALARRGAEVTLLEGYGWLLPRQLNERAGQMLAEHVRASGIKLLTKARTEEILGDERVRGVKLEDASVIAAELVVVATGIRPNSYLARLAGLEVDRGVVVDNLLRSSHPDVYAAGDVAEHRGVLYGTWAPSQYQGSIAGMNALGNHVEFGGIPRSNALKVLQVELFSIGQIQPEDASYDVIDQETDGGYLRFVFRDSHLVGAILLGDAKASPQVKRAIEGQTDFSDLLRKHPSAGEVIEHMGE
jgi:nitrite reductase (NADH) large subunit